MPKKLLQIISLLFLINLAFANLQLNLTQGINAAVPIAVVPFSGQPQQAAQPDNIAAVIQNDLKNSGRFNVMQADKIKQFPASIINVNFNYWRETGNDYMVVGQVQAIGNNTYQVSFSLINIVVGENQKPNINQSPIIISKRYIVSRGQLRALAHKISDIVYQQITGIRGIFSTRIAYVLVERAPGKATKYMLEVADADGYNPRPLLVSSEPIMSPAWSPNGKKIAYVSFANQRASVYFVNVATGKQQLITQFRGINGAPAWSPDGKQLAVVLSKNGHPKIYRLTIATKRLRQLTHGYSIDTEPNFAPDGKSIVFTSNRGGGPQIYQLILASGKIQRVTFDGKYNARPRFSPDGQSIVVLHQDNQGFNIALQDLTSGALTLLTHNGYDSSPSVAPNGQMVIYANNQSKKGTLGIVSTDGKIQLTLPAPEGTVEEPAWSPFLG